MADILQAPSNNVQIFNAPTGTFTFDGTGGKGKVGAGPVIWQISPGGVVLLLFTSFQATTSLVLGGGSITIGSASSTGGIVGTASAATAPQYLLSSGGQGALAGILKLVDASNGTDPLLVNESIQTFHTTADTTAGVIVCNALYVPITAGATLSLSTGVLQVETATIHETAPGVLVAGNMTVTVTAANSPALAAGKAITVGVTTNQTEAQVATAVKNALNADVDFAAFAVATNPTTVTVAMTALAVALDDSSMNIATADGTSIGIATTATSANTTFGQAAYG